MRSSFSLSALNPMKFISKKTHGISYIKGKCIDLIPTILFTGKIVGGLLYLKGD